MSHHPPQRSRVPFIVIATTAMLTVMVTAMMLAPSVARAAQSLIPLPYPGDVSGGQPLDPEPQRLGGPQTIMRDPYPQILGDNAQGNPPISRRHHHQHLVPSIYKRRYRVDRPGY